jgi:hypothetical protein
MRIRQKSDSNDRRKRVGLSRIPGRLLGEVIVHDVVVVVKSRLADDCGVGDSMAIVTTRYQISVERKR